MTQTTVIQKQQETTKNSQQEETWASFKTSFESLLREIISTANLATLETVDQSDQMKSAVTEAVGAVLLESNLIDKFLIRSLQNLPAENKKALANEICSEESLKQICEKSMRSLTMSTLVPTIRKEIKEVVTSYIKEFGKTEEFKAIIDSRFRMIEQYLRSDVIPKVVEKILKDR